MKQRLTYVLTDVSNFSLNQLKVDQDAFTVTGLQAAKEQHLTIGLDELPPEIRLMLRQCHELHIRWASTGSYEAVAPFSSRVSPGLHAFFTPQKNRSANLLCPQLKKIFGSDVKCNSPESSFTLQPVLSERFSRSSSSSYFQLMPSLESFITYVSHKICSRSSGASECEGLARELSSANYMDIDYDTISHAVIMRIYWSKPPLAKEWTETTRYHKGIGSLEVGVLNSEAPDLDEPDSTKLGGFLVVVGRDTEPKQTLFSFPARFQTFDTDRTSSSYSVSFDQPTGLHPTLRLSLPSAPEVPRSGRRCALHAFLSLPSYLFTDRYQFNDPLFLSSNNLGALRSLSGAADLEAPDWVIDQWGSAALFELSKTSSPTQQNEPWSATIPMHLRYLPPAHNASGMTEIKIPWPVVFWACEAEDGLKFPTSPFDRVNLGYEGLFGPKTMFFHLSPTPVLEAHITTEAGLIEKKLIETISIPVLDLNSPWAPWLEMISLLSIVTGIAWLLWCLVRPVKLLPRGRSSNINSREKKSQ